MDLLAAQRTHRHAGDKRNDARFAAAVYVVGRYAYCAAHAASACRGGAHDRDGGIVGERDVAAGLAGRFARLVQRLGLSFSQSWQAALPRCAQRARALAAESFVRFAGVARSEFSSSKIRNDGDADDAATNAIEFGRLRTRQLVCFFARFAASK